MIIFPTGNKIYITKFNFGKLSHDLNEFPCEFLQDKLPSEKISEAFSK